MFNRSGLLFVVAAMLMATLLVGCARKPLSPVEPEPRREWPLSPGAEEIYSFLVFADAGRKGDIPTAVAALERLNRIAPSPQVAVELANYHWRAGKLFKARDVLKKARLDYSESVGVALLLAQMYLSEKRVGDAVTTLRSFLNDNPGNLDVTQELAAVLVQQGSFADAVDLLKSLPEDQRTPDVRYYFAKAYAGLGLYKLAVGELKAAVEEDPDFLEAWAEMAYTHEKAKDYPAAEEVYARLLEMGGAESMGETGRELWVRLVDINLKLNNPERALQVVRQGPDDLSFQLKACVLFIDHGFYDEAESIIKPISEKEPVPSEAWFYLALLAYEGHNDLEAAAEYLARVPDNVAHYERSSIFLGNLLEEMGRVDEALDMAVAGKKRFPNQREFWLLEARILAGTKGLGDEAVKASDRDMEKALVVLEEAASKWADDIEVLYHLGILQDDMGMRREGLATMERIIERDPDHPDALNYVGYTLAELGKDLDRALVLVQRALTLKPDSGYIEDSLAWVHFRRKDNARAWEHIVRAVKLVDTNPVIWEHYGDIARAMGKAARAAKGYRKALELESNDSDAIRAKLESL